MLTAGAPDPGKGAVLVVFVDGVGLGPNDPLVNPLARARLPNLSGIARGSLISPGAVASDAQRPDFVDARLGVTGLPQSATGQTALLTGRNAARWLGRHWGPFPGRSLMPMLESTLWSALADAGVPRRLANAYPERYLERARRGTGRMGAVARSAVLAGVRLRGAAELASGRAVSAFITNSGWREHLGVSGLPEQTPPGAGEVLGGLTRAGGMTLFEFYATDIAGHRQDMTGAVAWLEMLDGMVGSAAQSLRSKDVLLVVSDHGNVEDLTTGGHTLNQALCLWYGPPPDRQLTSLTDVAPAVLAHLGVSPPPERRQPSDPEPVPGRGAS